MSYSSSAYIPRGSIPYSQHWNSKPFGFSRITDDSCPSYLDNYSKYYGPLTGVIDATYNRYLNKLYTTQFTTISRITATIAGVDRALTAKELASGLVFLDATLGEIDLKINQNSATDLVTELQTLFSANIVDGFSYNLTICREVPSGTIIVTYNDLDGAPKTISLTSDITSTTFTVVIKTVSPASFYVVNSANIP